MPLRGAAEPRRSSRRRQAAPPSQQQGGACGQDALAESVWGAESPWVAHANYQYLLTRHDGRTRLFRCSECVYRGDRLYHARMHYERIHVNGGRCMPSRHKYRADAAPRSAPRKRKRAAGPSGAPGAPGAAPRDAVDGKGTLPLARVFTFGSPFFQDGGPGLLFDAAGMRAFELPLFAEDGGPPPAGALASAALDSAAAEDADLGFLMPGYPLWEWEKFGLSDLVAGELEHWLCGHNKSTTQPPDAVHREAEKLIELLQARVRRSRVLLDSWLRRNK
jgi:hypothetical protein